MEKKLCKSRTDVKIDGVCAGIAKYLNIDVTIVRALFILFSISAGASIIPYIVLALVMPREEDYIDYTRNQN